MIEEIKKRLEAGDVVELECIDRDGFLKDIRRREPNERILDQAQLLVDHVDYDGDISLVGGIGDIYRNIIVSGEFKYFRIKGASYNKEDIANHTHKGVTSGVDTTKPSDGATFNDLIDAATQALKDGVVKEIGLFDNILMIQESHEAGRVCITISEVNQNGVCKYLGYIDSLYTETFVIESQSDLSIIKLNNKKTKVKLANGEIVNEEFWENIKDMTGKTQFLLLKGATVTQKRGKQ